MITAFAASDLMDEEDFNKTVNEFNQLMRSTKKYCLYEENRFIKDFKYPGKLGDNGEKYCKLQVDRCESLFCSTGGL
jgi:hypothetical protein